MTGRLPLAQESRHLRRIAAVPKGSIAYLREGRLRSRDLHLLRVSTSVRAGQRILLTVHLHEIGVENFIAGRLIIVEILARIVDYLVFGVRLLCVSNIITEPVFVSEQAPDRQYMGHTRHRDLPPLSSTPGRSLSLSKVSLLGATRNRDFFGRRSSSGTKYCR